MPGNPVVLDGRDDAELVRRCLDGDVEAFEPLVKAYERVLFNVAWRMLGDREEARDVVQTAFVRAYEKLTTYDPKYRFFSWIYRIAVNECLNIRDRRRPHQSLGAELASPGHPDDALEASERTARVRRGLMALSREYREVVVLKHFVGLSYGEIGATLGIPEKRVRSRLYTARQRLGQILLAQSIPR